MSKRRNEIKVVIEAAIERQSKRNLRPQQTLVSSLRDQVEAAKIEIHRMNPLRNHKKIGKRTRYFLRSIYGSKY